MATREEIREGIRNILSRLNDATDVGNPYTKEIMEYLHSEDVVIVKDWRFIDEIAIESLIKEKNDGKCKC